MIDTVTIKIKSGKGGDGRVSFLREKYRPNSGPDGGDGGRGGSIIFEADENMHTLRDFRSRPLSEAQDGEMGKGNKMFGKDGEDLVVKIPVGTLVYEIRRGDEVLVGDFNIHGQKMVMVKGGNGGKGNFRFRSSTNQTPSQFTHGGDSIEKEIRLEIKLVADCGIIGLPNAGKSTFINKVTKAAAKIGNYPFTTLEPNLGVCVYKNKKLVFADIPGLIEGASEGKGLGDEFLRHVERNKVLIHLIDPTFDADANGLVTDFTSDTLVLNSIKNYNIIRKELEDYKSRYQNLQEKQEIIVINKIDITEVKDSFIKLSQTFEKLGLNVFGISAFTGENIEEVLEKVYAVVEKTPEIIFEKVSPVRIVHIEDLKNRRIVFNVSDIDVAKSETAAL
jgi:GTP-binding protein